MRIAAKLLTSTRSFFSIATLCAAISGSWFHPDLVWPEVVLVKKSLARPIVYLGSITSNQFPSSTPLNCAPQAWSCGKQQNHGSVPDGVKLSFANKLRDQGVNVLLEKPSHGTFDEVSIIFTINELPSNPPIVPKHFVCDVNGGIYRLIEGVRQQSKVFEPHTRKLEPINESAAFMAVDCLNSATPKVLKGIRAINHPQNKNAK